MSHRWLPSLLALVCGFALAACGGGDDAGAGKTRGCLLAGGELGTAVPDGGILLGPDAWVSERQGGGAGWTWAGGTLTLAPGCGNLRTRENFGDCQLHVEFKVSANLGSEWKNDGNSGVYIQRRYELQILNSHGRDASDESCGAIYTERAPDTNASRPAGEWQAFDVVFRAARWEGGRRVQRARITAFHNGELIHDDVAISGKTGAGKPEAPSDEPLRLQDHGSPVAFRNVWIIPLNLD